jgi:hypothetical protein
MMKLRVACLLVTVGALICLAPAQETQAHSTSASAKSTPDPLQAATKPLSPKSAMPAPRKPAPAIPPKGGTNTTAELTHLEQQNVKAGGPKSNAAPAKAAPLKSADSSAGNGINFKYEKPAGGMKATTPNANTKNSNTPRVKKN